MLQIPSRIRIGYYILMRHEAAVSLGAAVADSPSVQGPRADSLPP